MVRSPARGLAMSSSFTDVLARARAMGTGENVDGKRIDAPPSTSAATFVSARELDVLTDYHNKQTTGEKEVYRREGRSVKRTSREAVIRNRATHGEKRSGAFETPKRARR